MADFGWLFAAPIAHRGLHDRTRGIIENTLSAAEAAAGRGFGIECDVQRSRDGEAVVFHDESLDRLTEATGPLAERSQAELRAIPLRDTSDRIVPLSEFLARIGGRVPIIVEIKSDFSGDMRLADRTAEIAASIASPIAIKSFDPDVIAHLRDRATLPARVPLGVVAEAHYPETEWPGFSAERRHALANFLHYERSRPDFVSWRVSDLPHAVPYLCRRGLGLPVMSWTIRTPEQARHARAWADQIVFEAFDPAAV
jgi:glycerophosphoryl diester phosphodiesterase